MQEQVKPDVIIPVLVLDEKDVESGPEELGRVLRYFVHHDDVCTSDFTGIIVAKPSGPHQRPIALQVQASTNADIHETQEGPVRSVYHVVEEVPVAENHRDKLPPGPYFLRGQNLHQAWRLYTDDLDAFLYGLIPESIADPDQ